MISKETFCYNNQEMFENNRRDITLAMMKNYPQLLHKFMADKAKVPPLDEIILHMNLELYSLKRQEQVRIIEFITVKVINVKYSKF